MSELKATNPVNELKHYANAVNTTGHQQSSKYSQSQFFFCVYRTRLACGIVEAAHDSLLLPVEASWISMNKEKKRVALKYLEAVNVECTLARVWDKYLPSRLKIFNRKLSTIRMCNFSYTLEKLANYENNNISLKLSLLIRNCAAINKISKAIVAL